ncbi:MAG: DoxX family membrane protein [Pseudomonadota bacterium]|nr:MAG: hypothetical protein DIU72_01890 [Pseudomonadota bacterium]
MRSHARQDVRGWNEAASASASVSAGLLALRLIGGSAMALHGAPKTLNPTSWMGPEGPPGWLQAMAAIAEFGGGLAWMAGALTPLACLGILATMITAIVIAHMPSGDPLPSDHPGGGRGTERDLRGTSALAGADGRRDPGRFGLGRAGAPLLGDRHPSPSRRAGALLVRPRLAREAADEAAVGARAE